MNPNETSGTSTVDDNFADEERTSVEILVRETLQNPLDARSDAALVRVRYKRATVEVDSSDFAKALFSDNWLKHFRSGKLMGDEGLPQRISFLIIEDFGTTGLEGAFDDSSREGKTENWNAFWFREGEGAKPTKSNGGAGQGKITLFLASQLRSVIALTHRESDGKELLFGCCRFKRNYKVDGDARRWAKEARWGATQDPAELALPITDPLLIASVKRELGLAREGLPGTSFIVPMPCNDIDETAIREAVINEFFFAICRGRLEVEVGDSVLSAATISEAADALGEKCRLPKNYRQFLKLSTKRAAGPPAATAKERWVKESKLSSAVFEEGELTKLKDTFDLSEMVAVDFPVMVKEKETGKSSLSSFRVFLQQDLNGESSQELFVRQDLAIDGEKRLRASRAIQPVMALTFIQESMLSDLLVAAEEPTHRTWNAKRPKVMALYVAPERALNAVRNAALRLVQLISPEGKRDETALAIYFADPSDDTSKKLGKAGSLPNTINSEPKVPEDLPKPKPKPINVLTSKDGFTVKAKGPEGYEPRFPIQCVVEVAYATTAGDAYRLWDAADFWLNYEDQFPIRQSGVRRLERDGNVLTFALERDGSELMVSGFDENRQLEVRVKYEEASDGTSLENN